MGNRRDQFGHMYNERSYFTGAESSKNGTNQNNSLTPNIKVPVEIAHSSFDFALYKKIKINPKIHEIVDIHWAPTSFSWQINLLTNRLWISGKLNAEIHYKKGTDASIHIYSLSFPWKKTVTVEYCYPPVLPLKNEKKQYDLSNDSSTTYEQIMHFNEQPTLDIMTTKMVTSKEIILNHASSYLELHIDCEMVYRIFQNQMIKYEF